MDQFEDNIEDQQDDDTLDSTQDDSRDSADDQTEDTDGFLNETEILLSMIDAAQNNQGSDFKDTFDSMLRLKINDKIEALKQEVSASLAGGNLSDDESQEESDDIQEEVQLSDEELDEFLEGLSDEELANLQEELQVREKKNIDEAGFDNIMNSIKADHAASQDKNAAKWAAERAASAQRLAQTRAKSEANSKSKARELEQKIKSETDSIKKMELQNRLKRIQSNLSESVRPKYTINGSKGEYVELTGSRKKAVNVAKRWFKGAKPSITRTPSRPKLEEGSSSLARRERKQKGIEKANNGDPFAGTPSKTKKGRTGGVGKYTGSYRSKMADSVRRWKARLGRGQGIPEAYNSKFPGWDRITSGISDYDKKKAEQDAKNVEAKKSQAQKTYTKAYTNYMKTQGKNPDGSPIKEACDTGHPSQLDWAREQLKKRRNKILKIKSGGPKANIKEMDDSTLQKYKQEAERLRKEKLVKIGKNIKKLAKRGYKFTSDEKDSK